MIIFVTRAITNVNEIENELKIQSDLTEEDIEYLILQQILGFDLETNDLDPYIGSILLVILGTEERQYVIDAFHPCISTLLEDLNKRIERIWLGANCKFDYKFIKVKYQVVLKKMFDVMIAEQRLVQGLMFYDGYSKAAFSSALDAIVERRIGFIPNGMDKKIREEFIGVNPNVFTFENKHIVYAANDIAHLFKIREIQKIKIKERMIEFLIYKIEFPLIRILADAELRGVDIDIDKWKANIIYNKEKQYEYQCKLDEEFRRLREIFLEDKDRIYFTNGKWDRERRKQDIVNQDNLFGDMFEEIEVSGVGKGKKKTKKEESFINYSSTDVLVSIFGALKQPLPTQQKINVVPTFVNKRLKNGTAKRKIDKEHWNFTTGEGAIESYLMEHPNCPIETFVRLLIEYRGYTTRLNTFGENFLIKFKNRITKKYHTCYRQCHAANGRLQSGDKDAGWFNSQNIPAEKSFREAFIARKGYKIATTDLSGAEAVIMIDKARDEKFYQMAILNDDAHSPLGTAVWKAIGNYRVSNGSNIQQRWKQKETDSYIYKTPAELVNITISKKENKEIRTEFKNTTFASIYGCKYKKYAKMLNIQAEEGKIGLRVMKQQIPKTFKMIEENAKFAQENGYIIFNHRTNSRIWYPQVLEAKKQGSDLEWSVLAEIDGSARNITISGTQADMVKEMMVEIGEYIEINKLDAHLVFQVHDELVYEFHESLTDFGDYVKNKMCEIGNKYLSFIKISAEQHIGESWTK